MSISRFWLAKIQEGAVWSHGYPYIPYQMGGQMELLRVPQPYRIGKTVKSCCVSIKSPYRVWKSHDLYACGSHMITLHIDWVYRIFRIHNELLVAWVNIRCLQRHEDSSHHHLCGDTVQGEQETSKSDIIIHPLHTCKTEIIINCVMCAMLESCIPWWLGHIMVWIGGEFLPLYRIQISYPCKWSR
jgi:hypothetical protein